ncbi:helix-turn-helix domain-containing protein [Corynebacterium sp.]|uniref:TetR/AcrR family transcriptional regulator n=1 Tax=Corynebacterium sp. TaxID=1720 RepID=UPI0028AD4E01|nr:helix-turn-helix domain-containing protein [Corynebacterium sp.]
MRSVEILEAAVAEFSAHGFEGATVRGIARAAGVSPGLVLHHFGSRDGLREACDDHVFEVLTESKRTSAAAGIGAVSAMLKDPTMRVFVDYLVASLIDPSDHGQRYFDHYVDVIEEILDDGFAGYTFRQATGEAANDRRARACAVALLALAPAMLHQRVGAVLGTPDMSGVGSRLGPQLFDIYLNGLIKEKP